MPSLRLAVSRPVVLLARVLQATLLLGLPSVSLAQATPSVSTIFAFSGSQTSSGPILVDGALYGTSATSTSSTGGLIFRATTDGSSIRTIYQLKIEDGYTPQGGLLLGSDKKFLYGTTRLGDLRQIGTTGTVFRIAPDGTGFKNLHRFASSDSISPINADGAFPASELVEGSDGYLYGVTPAGGPNGTGTVFKVASDGSDFRSLHAFGVITVDDTPTVSENADGVSPAGALVAGTDGYFYGNTSDGGENGRGTIFRVRFDGTGFQTLHAFSATTTSTTTPPTNADGAAPMDGLTDGKDGLYYGVTSQGGESGNGTLFAMSPDGSVFTVLHHFDGSDGAQPAGALLLGNDGRLYGTMAFGGTAGSGGTASNYGTLFVIGRDGTGFTKLHSFDGTQGANPVGRLLQLTDSVFVGATTSGGSCGQGTLYRFSLTGDTVTGNTGCGRSSSNNNSGGGSMTPAFLLLFGLLGFARRLRTR